MDIVVYRVKRIRKLSAIPVYLEHESQNDEPGQLRVMSSSGPPKKMKYEQGRAEVVLFEKDLSDLRNYQEFILQSYGGLLNGTYEGQSNTLFGNGVIKLFFDSYFLDGFKASFSSPTEYKFLIIVKSNIEKSQSNLDLETQEKIFSALIEKYLPSRKKEINALLRKSYYILPPQNTNKANSNVFLGASSYKYSINDRKMVHLGGFSLKLLRNSTLEKDNEKNEVHFFSEDQEEEVWDESANTTYISNHNHEVYDRIKIGLREYLELPDHKSGFIEHLNFNEKEKEYYIFLESIIEYLISYPTDKILGYPKNYGCLISQAVNKSKGIHSYNTVSKEELDQWEMVFKISPNSHFREIIPSLEDSFFYFFMKKEDINAGNYKNYVVIMDYI